MRYLGTLGFLPRETLTTRDDIPARWNKMVRRYVIKRLRYSLVFRDYLYSPEEKRLYFLSPLYTTDILYSREIYI